VTVDPAESPLKVCRHCSVATRTEATACPNCGRSYARQPFKWRWWYAIPIVVIAFALGFFGISNLVWDDDSGVDSSKGLTLAEAQALPDSGPPSDIETAADGHKPVDTRDQSEEGADFVCRYYTVIDVDRTVWEACYLSGQLEVSRPFQLKK
jgi:hypothetical protein